MSAPAHRVLIVEDNPDSRETLRVLLQVWGYRVDTAEDGRDGLDKALAWAPDAAIVDIGLPVLDGLQVAREVRQALPDRIRLIALTAYSEPEYRRAAAAAGFDYYLTKPADLEELAGALAACGLPRGG